MTTCLYFLRFLAILVHHQRNVIVLVYDPRARYVYLFILVVIFVFPWSPTYGVRVDVLLLSDYFSVRLLPFCDFLAFFVIYYAHLPRKGNNLDLMPPSISQWR